MRIDCPHCGFGREVPDEKVPERSEMATCPRCGEKFRFRVLEDSVGPEGPSAEQPEAESASSDDSRYGPDARLHVVRDAERRDRGKNNTPPESDDGIPQVLPPFEDLEQFGFFPGMTQSIKRAMFSPKLFFQVMPLKGLARPLVFALLLFEFYMILSLFWSVTGLPPLASLLGGSELLNSDVAGGPTDPVVLFVILPMMFVINLFLSVGLLHGVLRLLHAAPRGFEATFRAAAYSYAPLVLTILPYGYLAGWIWSLYITAVGCAAIHRVQVWRAVLGIGIVAGFVAALYLGSLQMPHPGVPS